MTTTVFVALMDREGLHDLGRIIPVEIEFEAEIDKSYGADADGNRGMLSKSLSILEENIEPGHIETLDSWQVEQILKDARSAFDRTIR